VQWAIGRSKFNNVDLYEAGMSAKLIPDANKIYAGVWRFSGTELPVQRTSALVWTPEFLLAEKSTKNFTDVFRLKVEPGNSISSSVELIAENLTYLRRTAIRQTADNHDFEDSALQ